MNIKYLASIWTESYSLMLVLHFYMNIQVAASTELFVKLLICYIGSTYLIS